MYFLVGVLGRKSFKPLFIDIKNNVKRRIIIEKFGRCQVEHIVIIAITCIPMAMYLFLYLTKILPKPLIGHDMLNYGIMGRILFEEKSLAPIWVEDFASSGYQYWLKSAPSFSLILTWDELVNSIFDLKSDLYFKSVSAYFGLLILITQYFWISKQNRWLALLSAVALLSGTAFYLKFFYPHIDTYRIYFFLISLIYLVCVIERRDMLSLVLFGIFSGSAAFAHRIGVVTTVIICASFFVFIDKSFKWKIIQTVIILVLILAFGGGHYVFDLILGRGNWIQGK